MRLHLLLFRVIWQKLPSLLTKESNRLPNQARQRGISLLSCLRRRRRHCAALLPHPRAFQQRGRQHTMLPASDTLHSFRGGRPSPAPTRPKPASLHLTPPSPAIRSLPVTASTAACRLQREPSEDDPAHLASSQRQGGGVFCRFLELFPQ
ncbi:hypothetical protein CRENBAI_014413 [Crenichthys baileyi]|uniref:Uncharacterized protein n=1 Tax=Crenichthys baileyi TaxID=28760 RepID=A0AAV9RJR5_9TELE